MQWECCTTSANICTGKDTLHYSSCLFSLLLQSPCATAVLLYIEPGRWRDAVYGTVTMAVRRDAAVTPRNEGGEGLGPCHSGDLLQPPSPRPAPPLRTRKAYNCNCELGCLCCATLERERCSVCVCVDCCRYISDIRCVIDV